MRQFFPVEELARDERFHKITMRDRMNDPRAGGGANSNAEQSRRSTNRLTPERRQHDTGNKTRIRVRREKYICGRDFFRLRRPLERCLLPELRDFLFRRPRVGSVERRPDRPGRHAVHADATLDQILRECFRQRVNRAFRGRVIRQLGGSLDTDD